MRLLLDTHAVSWWLTDRKRLSKGALDSIGDPTNEVFSSVVNCWEMAIKVGVGRWPEAASLVGEFERELAMNGWRLLSITVQHVRAAGLMQVPHRDPFDRLLAAQAQIEGLTLVTADPKVQSLAVSWLWS